MFELGARPHPPRDLYRAYLDQSDIFVGLYWRAIRLGGARRGRSRAWRTSTAWRRPRCRSSCTSRSGAGASPDWPTCSTASAPTTARRTSTSPMPGSSPARARRPRDAARRAVHAVAASPVDEPLRLDGRHRRAAGGTHLAHRPGARAGGGRRPARRRRRAAGDADRSGGIGKSRLSIDAANRVHDRFPGGVAFVDLLARDRIPSSCPAAIANALGITRHRRRHARREAAHGGARPTHAAAPRQRRAGRRRRARHPVAPHGCPAPDRARDEPHPAAASRGEHGIDLGPLALPDMRHGASVGRALAAIRR